MNLKDGILNVRAIKNLGELEHIYSLYSLRVTCGRYDNGECFSHIEHWGKNRSSTPLKRPRSGATIVFDGQCPDVDACAASICAMHHQMYDEPMDQCQKVKFNERPSIVEITPYSEVYEFHPHLPISTANGQKQTPSRGDPFTGNRR